MKTFGLILPTLCAGVIAVAGTSSLRAQSANIERGRYIVDQVGACGYCHTPRLANGEPDKANYLKGMKKLDMGPIGAPTIKRADHSQDLTSTSKMWERWGDKGVVTFLETAKNPKGHHADAPMPRYQMKAEDAEAVTAYLKSLK
ncbi:MAG TPA: c-type cytochrome [Bryobacteraceae bacterium]|nr:c-type cytochrome [Bryobacteraceae bacterium]